MLVPVTGLEGLEIDGMPHVLHAGENVAHRRTPPAVGIFKLAVSAVASALCGKIGRRAKHLFLGQNIRDLVHTLAVNDHTEDTAYNSGCFLVDDPALFVLRVFQIPVDGMIAGVFALVALCPVDGADLLACITSVKIVEHTSFGKVKRKQQKSSIHAGLRRDGSRSDSSLSNGQRAKITIA